MRAAAAARTYAAMYPSTLLTLRPQRHPTCTHVRLKVLRFYGFYILRYGEAVIAFDAVATLPAVERELTGDRSHHGPAGTTVELSPRSSGPHSRP